MKGDIKKLKVKKNREGNIWKTITNIEKIKRVVIRTADKEGGLVIHKNKDYELEMENLLKMESKKGYKKKLKT